MIFFLASVSKKIGNGHYYRSKSIENFFNKKKRKTVFIKFKSILELKRIFKKFEFKSNDIIFFDSYIFNKELKFFF